MTNVDLYEAVARGELTPTEAVAMMTDEEVTNRDAVMNLTVATLLAFWRSFRWWIPAIIAAAVLSALLCACPPRKDVPPPITPADVPDGACQAAQERLERLGCEEARTPAGEPFGEACERARARGASWCPVAVSSIDYCSEFEAAAEGRRGGC